MELDPARHALDEDTVEDQGVEVDIGYPSWRRKRQALTPTRTTAKATRARRWGYRVSAPAPFTSTPRAITAKWATGFSTVRGWIQAGIASIGVRAPERLASGGLTKKLI